jgi:hypothetical protein
VLQQDVGEMTIRAWSSEVMGWRTGTENAAQGATSSTTPLTAAPNASIPGGAEMFTGLEVALQLRDRPTKLVKVFLLGAV